VRKTKLVTIPRFEGAHNRDEGKHFLLTEWPAAVAEKWGFRIMLAFNRSSTQIPLDLKGLGIEGVAILGINTFLRGNVQAEEIVPIIDELLDCAKMVRDLKALDPVTSQPFGTDVLDNDIEEVATRLWLRSEVLALHTGFSVVDALSALWSSITARTEEISSTTSTSPPGSG
jgi:hypothetical protein